MWKNYITLFYILIVLRYNSCCECNLNHTDLNKEKRQLLESEEFSATTEYLENTPGIDTNTKETTLDFPTSTFQYLTTILDIHETTTDSYESIIRIFEIEANKSHIAEENNTLDNIFDISENSSEVIEPMNNEAGRKHKSEFVGDNETTADKLGERRNTEKLSELGEIEKNNERGETVEQSHDDLRSKCRRYKNGNTFKLHKMAGLWQVVYYRLPNRMKCFKINIKLVKIKEQQRYARVYGNFNDTVNWERCFLEITSTETAFSGRRHFLQGGESDRGAMGNVIIDEEYSENTTYLTLHSEGGDQWLVINNLLLMRDCDNGDYVVFSRYPKQPRRTDIMVALKKFGESNPKGTIACNIEKSWLTQKEENHENSENHENHSVQRREDNRHFNKNITAGVNYNSVVDL